MYIVCFLSVKFSLLSQKAVHTFHFYHSSIFLLCQGITVYNSCPPTFRFQLTLAIYTLSFYFVLVLLVLPVVGLNLLDNIDNLIIHKFKIFVVVINSESGELL